RPTNNAGRAFTRVPATWRPRSCTISTSPTNAPRRSCGRRPRTRSSRASPDFANESPTQDTRLRRPKICAGLRRLADVAVMQATDFGNLHDPVRLGALDGPDVRRILVEREMRASPVIVGEVAGQDAAQVAFAENQNVI